MCQTVKFGLCRERVPREKSSGLFSVSAKFFDRPISAQVFRPVCCITYTVFKEGLQILLLPRTERFQYNPCSFDEAWTRIMRETVEARGKAAAEILAQMR